MSKKKVAQAITTEHLIATLAHIRALADAAIGALVSSGGGDPAKLAGKPVDKNCPPPIQDKHCGPPIWDKHCAPPIQDKHCAPPIQDKHCAPPIQDKPGKQRVYHKLCPGPEEVPAAGAGAKASRP